jgi:hypothetical protein
MHAEELSLSGEAISEKLSSLAERHRAEATVVISQGAVCRAVEVPRDEPEVVNDALGLLAEAELPDLVPAHRRGAGAVPGGATAGMTAGLLVGLPPGCAADGAPAGARVSLTAEPVAACALLAALCEGRAPIGAAVIADRESGTVSAAAFGEHATAARSVFQPGEDQIVFDAGVESILAAACRRTGVDAGERLDVSVGGRRVVVCGPAARSGVAGFAKIAGGMRDGADWIAGFAPAVALGLMAMEGGVARGGLLGMTRDEPRERRSRFERVASALSSSTAVVVTLALLLFAITLLPAVAQYVRMSKAESKVAAYERVIEASEDGDGPSTDQLIAYYELIERERVPMTKLLADIAAALPADSPGEIALVERITLDRGDGFTIEGTTREAGHPERLVSALANAGVFSEITPSRIGSPAEPGAPIEFEVQGAIRERAAWLEARGVRDYAAHPAAEFIYGLITDEQIAAAEQARLDAEREAREAARQAELAAREASQSGEDADAGDGQIGGAVASGTGQTGDGDAPLEDESEGGGVVAGAEGDAGEGTGAVATRRRPSDGSTRRPVRDESAARAVAEGGSEEIKLSDDEERERSRRQVFEGGSRTEQDEAQPDPIPEPLTDEQIAAMDNIEALKARLERNKLIRQADDRDDIDDEVVERLRDESRRLHERARQAKEEKAD